VAEAFDNAGVTIDVRLSDKERARFVAMMAG
jgi:hypothetical protein